MHCQPGYSKSKKSIHSNYNIIFNLLKITTTNEKQKTHIIRQERPWQPVERAVGGKHEVIP